MSTHLVLAAVAGILAAAAGTGAHLPADVRRHLVVASSRQGFLAVFRFDPDAGPFLEETSRLRILSGSGSGEPLEVAFLASAADGRALYAAARPAAASKAAAADSCILTLSLDPSSGVLVERGRVASGGSRPTHVALDKSGRSLLAVNNESNSISIFPLMAERLPGPAAQTLPTGVGPHQAAVDTSGRFVFVPNRGEPRDVNKGSREPGDDLPGSNTVSQFRLSGGRLTPGKPAAVTIGKGINPAQNPHPRHMAFHPGGRWAYVCNGLNDTVAQLALDRRGIVSELQSEWIVPESRRNKPPLPYRADPAEIAVHPSGRFLYVSSGAASCIAVFRINQESGRLHGPAYFPTGGEHPRHFSLDPTGSWLVVGNDRSNTMVLFRVNPESGSLSQAASFDFPEPWCQIFVPPGQD